jgi:GxxExxY protein
MATRMNADIHGWTRMRIHLAPRLEELTRKIIGAAFTVSSSLGHGFLEVVYRNALAEELVAAGLAPLKEKPFPIHYRGKQVGLYIADLVVEDEIIVELKAVDALGQAHKAQLLNYLKASGLAVGLLLNFGRPRLEMRRIIK